MHSSKIIKRVFSIVVSLFVFAGFIYAIKAGLLERGGSIVVPVLSGITLAWGFDGFTIKESDDNE